MTYLPTLHAYLHQSSLLLQAYPHTTRITTKYSLPRKSKSPTDSTAKASESETAPVANSSRQKRDPSATLTLKTFHPESGICLKYRTDKAAEVGRLMTGLGRLAKGEVIELPTGNGDGGDVPGSGIAIGNGEALSGGGPDANGDGTTAMEGVQPSGQAKTATQMTQQTNSGGGGKKKKKGKK